VSRVTVRVVALLALILMPPLALALYLVGCSSCLPAVNFNAGWGDSGSSRRQCKPVRSTTCWNLSS
jgi:hypothetical protein